MINVKSQFSRRPVLALVVVTALLLGGVTAIAGTATAQEDELTFDDQATASSTITSDNITDPSVTVEDVTAEQESAIVVTYEDDGDLIIAGLDTFDEDELEGNDITIGVEDDGGFPGQHTAHIIPIDGLSDPEYEPGDPVSEDTADAVVTNEGAMVFQGTLEFGDQEFEAALEEGSDEIVVDTADLLDGENGDTAFVVDVHPTDDDGELVATEFVGSSDVLSGENSDVSISLEQIPADGDFNDLPIDAIDDFVAMIHVVDDGASPGDEATPGDYPVLPNVDSTEGPVAGGITDDATLIFDELSFNDQATASSTIQNDITDAGVVVEDVTAVQESAVVVTYEDNGDVIIAGLETFDAEDLDGDDVTVAVEDDGGFPGEHTAHLIPVDGLSGDYESGDTVSANTVANVSVNEAAGVLQGTLDFADLEFDDAVNDEITVETADLVDGINEDTLFQVDIHPTDADDELIGDEFVGSSAVLSGENEDVAITLQDSGGGDVEIDETDDFVAMIHIVDDDNIEEGDQVEPGTFPVIQNADAEAGFVAGGVTDQATITIDDEDDDDDDGIPGFGIPVAIGAITTWLLFRVRKSESI